MKKAIIIVLLLVALILLFPIRGQFKDGGSVEYRAILYTVYDVHSLYDDGSRTEVRFVEGTIIEVLGHQVYNNTTPHIENFGDSPNAGSYVETKIVIDRDAVTKIEIERYNVSDEEALAVTVTEKADIQHIVDNLTSLKLQMWVPAHPVEVPPTAREYELDFYNAEEEIITTVSISLDGLVNFYSVIDGELDTAHIAELFE